MLSRRAFLSVLSVLPWLVGCGRHIVTRQGFAFGTLIELSALGQGQTKVGYVLDEVLAEFDRLHRLLHAWEPSPLSSLNVAISQGREQASLPPELVTLLLNAAEWSRRSHYLFNPAIGGLIRLWGFWSDQFQPILPSIEERKAWVDRHPSLDDLIIRGTDVGSRNHAVQIDLGGYAKGYALDRALAILQRAGIKQGLINIGGNVMALGNKAGESWQVGIRHPRRHAAMALIPLYNGEAIGTSGDYQRFFELNGQRYCHLINPKTGAPAIGTAAVTVVIPAREDAGVCSDVLSKPLFIGGRENWKGSAQGLSVELALRIDSDGQKEVLPKLASRLEWL